MRPLTELWNGDREAFSVETCFVKKDGTSTHVRVTTSLQFDLEVRPLFFLNLVEDINDRAEAEQDRNAALEALRAREERYRNAFQTCPDGVLITRLNDGKIIEANPAFLDVMRYDTEDVLGRTSLDLGM